VTASTKFADLDKAVKDMLREAKTFDERKQGVDTAIKFEMLKLKSKGGQFGRGFTDEPGGEDEDD
jgi:hypothetical protein